MRPSAGSSANTSTRLLGHKGLLLSFRYITHVDFSPAVGRHNLLLRCLPSREAFQSVRHEEFCLSDDFSYKESMDGLGNRIVTASTDAMHSHIDYSCTGEVDTSTYCIPDAAPHPIYSLPSRLTATTPAMHCLLPSATGQFLADCMQIAHAVHHHFQYTPGATDMLTTASDAFAQRKGVCQDYAHLMIALCRKAGIPARYACGLMMGEGQTHAWVEVHDGQCWYAFDPTNDAAIATGYIKLAHGRDAADCAVSRGVYFGLAQENTCVNVMVKKL